MKQQRLKFPKQQKAQRPVFDLWAECMRMAFEDHLKEIAEAGRDKKKLAEIVSETIVRDAWYIFCSKKYYIWYR